MSELEQAKIVLAQSESVLKQSEENLTKTQTFNEVMVEQNRRLSFALSTLLPKDVVVQQRIYGDVEVQQKPFEELAEDIAKGFKQREVFDIVHAINVLAMVNTDVINVFVDFSGHVNEFSVYVNPADTVYENGSTKIRLMTERVYINHEDALEKLLSIESKLTEVIIEAREEAEAKAEVEA